MVASAVGIGSEYKACSRCEKVLPVSEFYFASKKTGTRRDPCKECMAIVKRMQREPGWFPDCSCCGKALDRAASRRRLCLECQDDSYTDELLQRIRLPDCSACGFPRARDGKNQAGTRLCHACRSVPSSRRQRLSRLFNMTPREYLELLDYQGGVCAICKKKPRSGKVLGVDHRHGLRPSRIIRGLLCNRCNLLISQAQDSPDLLKSAAAFLACPPAQVLYPGREAAEEADHSGRIDHWTAKRKQQRKVAIR